MIYTGTVGVWLQGLMEVCCLSGDAAFVVWFTVVIVMELQGRQSCAVLLRVPGILLGGCLRGCWDVLEGMQACCASIPAC